MMKHVEIIEDPEFGFYPSLGGPVSRPVEGWMRRVSDRLQHERGIEPQRVRFVMVTDGHGGEMWRPAVVRE